MKFSIFRCSNRTQNLIILFFSLLLSLILMKILFIKGLWYQVFIFLNVPAGGYDIADAKSIYDYSEKFYKNGFVPADAVDFWNRKYASISVFWLKLSLLLKFHISNNFYSFVYIMFSSYFFALFKVAAINKNLLDFFLISMMLFSTSSLYLIERGNFDLVLFFLTFILISFDNSKYKFFLICFLSFLKINLVCLFLILIKNVKTIILMFLASLMIIIINYNYIQSGYSDIGSSADLLHYGLFTITKSLLHTFNKIFQLDLNINQENIKLGFILMLFFSSLIVYLFLKYINFKKIKLKRLEINFTKKEELFILGASFYIFSFLTFSAPDYKLVFLILTLPFFLDNKQLYWKEIILLFIVLNSSIFEVFALRDSIFTTNIVEVYSKFSFRYFVIGVFIHFLKMALFYLILKNIFKFYKDKINTI